MAKKVFESPDLIRLIYSFGNPDHRRYMRNIKLELQSQTEAFEDEFQKKRGFEGIDYVLEHYYSMDELIKYLRTFKRCFCCSRHSMKKPIYSDKIVFITKKCVFQNYETECACPCRSLSRVFVKSLRSKIRRNAIEE